MSDNALKTPFHRSLDLHSVNTYLELDNLKGMSLPASVVSVEESNTIVRVKFEVNTQVGTQQLLQLPEVTCPVFGPQYLRYPIQVGDQGVCLSATAYLGGVSGLGPGPATLAQPGNLGALVFFPVGNRNFTASENPNAAILYGPDGAIVRDEGNTTHIKVDGQGNVIIWGARSVSTDVHGYGQRITYTGGNSWQIDNYTQGASVTTVNHPVNQPEIPPP
jgi:hypothetical protein